MAVSPVVMEAGCGCITCGALGDGGCRPVCEERSVSRQTRPGRVWVRSKQPP